MNNKACAYEGKTDMNMTLTCWLEKGRRVGTWRGMEKGKSKRGKQDERGAAWKKGPERTRIRNPNPNPNG